MQYDPIKRTLGKVFNKTPFLRVLFYKLLDLLLLRAWHIRKEIRQLTYKRSSALSILDAGSGFGQYSHYLATRFKKSEILGVDVKEEQIDDCNRFAESVKLANRMRFEVADLTRFVHSSKYDLILSVDVMEHIKEDELVFKNLCESLRKGGVLLISTPSDRGGSDVHSEEDHSFIDEHVRDGYNIEDISTKLRNAGFSEVHPRYSYGKPGSLAWKISMKIPVILLNTSKLFFVLLPFYYLLVFPPSLLLNIADLFIRHKSGTGLIVKAVK